MNRERIQTVAFLSLGEALSTGAMSPNAAQFTRSPKGQEMLQQWRNLAVEYDPALAQSLLDEIIVVDLDGDGWRDLPSGAPLEVRLDFPAGDTQFVETAEVIKEVWEGVGLNAFVNTVPGEQLGLMTTDATYDIRLYACAALPGALTQPASSHSNHIVHATIRNRMLPPL
jgi:peptide/nickel transport system substrate-binding protein